MGLDFDLPVSLHGPRSVVSCVAHLMNREYEVARNMGTKLFNGSRTVLQLIGPRPPSLSECDDIFARLGSSPRRYSSGWTARDLAELLADGLDTCYDKINAGIKAYCDKRDKQFPEMGWNSVSVVVDRASEKWACPCCGGME